MDVMYCIYCIGASYQACFQLSYIKCSSTGMSILRGVSLGGADVELVAVGIFLGLAGSGGTLVVSSMRLVSVQGPLVTEDNAYLSPTRASRWLGKFQETTLASNSTVKAGNGRWKGDVELHPPKAGHGYPPARRGTWRGNT